VTARQGANSVAAAVNSATDVGDRVKETSGERQSGRSEREGCDVGFEVLCKDKEGMCLCDSVFVPAPVPSLDAVSMQRIIAENCGVRSECDMEFVLVRRRVCNSPLLFPSEV
jgi:hypothetical protein